MRVGKKKDNEPEPLEINMTPMIDVVFLLIVFFMIVVDLTQQEIVQLVLPPADHAVPDKKPEKNRLLVNVTWDKDEQKAEIWVKRNQFDLDQLKSWMYPIARSKIEPKTKFSKIPILIRCDRDAPFRVVQQIMQICGDKDIQIYKVMLAAAEAKPEKD